MFSTYAVSAEDEQGESSEQRASLQVGANKWTGAASACLCMVCNGGFARALGHLASSVLHFDASPVVPSLVVRMATAAAQILVSTHITREPTGEAVMLQRCRPVGRGGTTLAFASGQHAKR